MICMMCCLVCISKNKPAIKTYCHRAHLMVYKIYSAATAPAVLAHGAKQQHSSGDHGKNPGEEKVTYRSPRRCSETNGIAEQHNMRQSLQSTTTSILRLRGQPTPCEGNSKHGSATLELMARLLDAIALNSHQCRQWCYSVFLLATCWVSFPGGRGFFSR